MASGLDLVMIARSEHDVQRARMVVALVSHTLHPASSLGGHEDARRRIVDLTPQVKLYAVKDVPGLQLGNHYHRQMDEWYFAVSGKFKWVVGDVDTGRTREVRQEEGSVIYVPRGVAHVVSLSPHAVFMGYVEPCFDEKDFVPYRF